MSHPEQADIAALIEALLAGGVEHAGRPKDRLILPVLLAMLEDASGGG